MREPDNLGSKGNSWGETLFYRREREEGKNHFLTKRKTEDQIVKPEGNVTGIMKEHASKRLYSTRYRP